MRQPYIPLAAALLCACGANSAPTPDAPPTGETSPPETRCFEGEYRLYDAVGGIRDTSLVAVRYTIHDDKIVMDDIERGGEHSSQTFVIEQETVRTSSEDYDARGQVVRRDGTIELTMEGTAGPNATQTTTTIGPETATEIWRISSNDPDSQTAGYIAQHLLRVDDADCEGRFAAVADGERPTLARRGDLLVATAGKNAEAADPITFAFRWPQNMSAVVWGDTTQERNGSVVKSRTPYRLGATADARGTKIVFDANYSELFTGDGTEAIRNAVQATDYLAYPFVVDGTGAIAGLADYAATAAIARTGLQAQVGPEASALVDAAFTQRSMLQSVSKFWDPMVGAWRGATMKPGEVRENIANVPITTPFGQTVAVRARNTFTAIGRVPCRRGDDGADCVLLEMTQQTDPEHAAGVLAAVHDKLDVAQKPPAVASYEMKFTALTVLDPDTLLPYEYLELTQVSIAFDAQDPRAAPAPVVRVEAKTLTFHYR